MRHLVSLALTLALGTSAAVAGDPPLRGAECLDPARVRNWIHVDDRHFLVDAGRQKYKVSLSFPCHDLAFSPTLSFRGDPVTGRVCGIAMDTVSTRDMLCKIARVEALDAEAWKAATARKPKKSEKQEPATEPAADAKG